MMDSAAARCHDVPGPCEFSALDGDRDCAIVCPTTNFQNEELLLLLSSSSSLLSLSLWSSSSLLLLLFVVIVVVTSPDSDHAECGGVLLHGSTPPFQCFVALPRTLSFCRSDVRFVWRRASVSQLHGLFNSRTGTVVAVLDGKHPLPCCVLVHFSNFQVFPVKDKPASAAMTLERQFPFPGNHTLVPIFSNRFPTI